MCVSACVHVCYSVVSKIVQGHNLTENRSPFGQNLPCAIGLINTGVTGFSHQMAVEVCKNYKNKNRPCPDVPGLSRVGIALANISGLFDDTIVG